MVWERSLRWLCYPHAPLLPAHLHSSEEGLCTRTRSFLDSSPVPSGHTLVCNPVFLFPREKDGIQRTRQVLLRLGLDPLQEDCVATRRVCQIVSTRSASLCAATLVAVLRRLKENKGEDRLRSTIGVDGSVYKKHPQ